MDDMNLILLGVGYGLALLWPQETKKDAIVKRVSPGGWCDIPNLWKALHAGHNMLEVWACSDLHVAFVQKCVFCSRSCFQGRPQILYLIQVARRFL